MIRINRVDAKAYYNTLPPLGHQCGDIWRDLPSFGMLGDKPCAGLIITPACDLSWQKSDTLTYLPIVPIRTYFSMDAALPAVIERIVSSFQATGCVLQTNWGGQSFVPPSDEEIAAMQNEMKKLVSAQQCSNKVISAINKVQAGLSIVNAIKGASLQHIGVNNLSTLFGAEWSRIKERIVRNSYSPALHFLPNDGQDEVFSGVSAHSVVLFRCPITVPVKMLNYAEETSASVWNARVQSMEISETMRTAFSVSRPMKLLSLKASFLSDLLTRFSALYNRVGSADFTNETVAVYSSEVDQ